MYQLQLQLQLIIISLVSHLHAHHVLFQIVNYVQVQLLVQHVQLDIIGNQQYILNQ